MKQKSKNRVKVHAVSGIKLGLASMFLGAAALAAAAATSTPSGIPQPPLISKFEMQIIPDKVVGVQNSLGNKNLSASNDALNVNVVSKVSSGAQATVQLSVPNSNLTFSYGFGVLYNQFISPASSKFQTDVLDKGLITWFAKPRTSLALDPTLSKSGFMTVYALVKDADGKFQYPLSGSDDLTYMLVKNTSSTPATSTTTQSASITIQPAYDSTTVDTVLIPTAAPMQLGKWGFLAANNETIALNKVTFQLFDENGKLITNASEFDQLSLYDPNHPDVPLAVSKYVGGSGKGLVQFNLSKPWLVHGTDKSWLILKGVVKSGFKPGSIRRWGMRITAPSSIDLRYSSGLQLANQNIKFVPYQMLSTPAPVMTAPGQILSTRYIFHNALPLMQNISLGSDLVLSEKSQILKFTVTNPGDRELRLGSIATLVGINGMASDGVLKNWQLWDASTSSTPPFLLAATSTCQLVGKFGLPGCSLHAALNMASPTFEQTNQIDQGFSSLVVPAGTTRTFVLTADTTGVLQGKTSGVVTVTAKLNTWLKKSYMWENGPISYFYSLDGGKEYGPFGDTNLISSPEQTLSYKIL